MMQCTTRDEGVCSARLSGTRISKAAFIAGMLDTASHNIQHFRVGGASCPGKRGADWKVGELVRSGHASILRIRLARLVAESGHESIAKECRAMDVDAAAMNGHLGVIRELRRYGIDCTSHSADWAAVNGHVDIVRDLQDCGIHCSSRGADLAAAGGHLEVIRAVITHGAPPLTSNSADQAAKGGHLALVRELRAHNIHCTPNGAAWAAENSHAEVVQDLEAQGIVAGK